MKTEILTHEQMVARMLKNPAVRAEHDRLNREEFAMLDEILAARREAGLSPLSSRPAGCVLAHRSQ